MAIRLDKFLWSIRVFKTRTDAADAARNNRVSVNGAWAKASREVTAGDVIDVRKGAVTFRYRVLEPIGNRQPAKEVSRYAEDVTPQAERDKLSAPKETIFVTRDRGTGRPTKKERRDIEKLILE